MIKWCQPSSSILNLFLTTSQSLVRKPDCLAVKKPLSCEPRENSAGKRHVDKVAAEATCPIKPDAAMQKACLDHMPPEWVGQPPTVLWLESRGCSISNTILGCPSISFQALCCLDLLTSLPLALHFSMCLRADETRPLQQVFFYYIRRIWHISLF